MTPDPATPDSPPRRRLSGPAGLAILVLAALVGVSVMERYSRPRGGDPYGPVPLPPLLVEGWLNTPADGPPTPDSLRGRYVVVDSWATWCGPCVVSLPRLAKFYEKWSDRGVEILGLTSEAGADVEAVRSVVDRIDGMQWPIGYGAGMLNDQMGVRMLPTYTLYGPDGRSLWRGHSVDALENELASRM